jgi:hypothetical protein
VSLKVRSEVYDAVRETVAVVEMLRLLVLVSEQVSLMLQDKVNETDGVSERICVPVTVLLMSRDGVLVVEKVSLNVSVVVGVGVTESVAERKREIDSDTVSESESVPVKAGEDVLLIEIVFDWD